MISPQKYFNSDVVERINKEASEIVGAIDSLRYFKMKISSESEGIYRVVFSGQVQGVDICSQGFERDILRAVKLSSERFYVQSRKVEKIKKIESRKLNVKSYQYQGGYDEYVVH